MNKETMDRLVRAAVEARENSYCPYSHFAVGAALLADDGELFTGANIESSSYTPTVCAERVAFFSAIHAGKRSFAGIAIVGGKEGEDIASYTPPCGVCRQVMAEFCDTDFAVVLFDGKATRTVTLGELLPESFGKENLS